ncbi:MAG TPA: hypothetical protein VFU47_08635, partial [Armatimonadota bacterium]|nr:hypothetical protein [Armatimonadota bacterium]
LLLASAVAAAPEAPAGKQAELFTEVRLSLDHDRLDPAKVRPGQEKQLAEALKERLLLLGPDGRVEVHSLDDIRVRVRSEKVDALQLENLVRIGRLEIRHLDDVQTSLDPDARYLLDVQSIQDADGTHSSMRFRDRKTGKVVPTPQFLERCPLLAANADLLPGSARAIQGGSLIAVRIQFNPVASRRLRRFFERPGRLIATALDGEIISLNASTEKPKKGKREKEEDGAEEVDLLGGFRTPEECNYLALILNSKPLPFPVRVVSTRLTAE